MFSPPVPYLLNYSPYTRKQYCYLQGGNTKPSVASVASPQVTHLALAAPQAALTPNPYANFAGSALPRAIARESASLQAESSTMRNIR